MRIPNYNVSIPEKWNNVKYFIYLFVTFHIILFLVVNLSTVKMYYAILEYAKLLANRNAYDNQLTYVNCFIISTQL